MIARPSSTTGAVRTSFAPRGWMRKSFTKGQLTISLAGIESRVASAAHAFSARVRKVFRSSADQRSSSVKPKSGIRAASRQCEMASDNHGVCASVLLSAASRRYLRNTLMATSYAQKPRPAYRTKVVLLTNASPCGVPWPEFTTASRKRLVSPLNIPSRTKSAHRSASFFRGASARCGVSPFTRPQTA